MSTSIHFFTNNFYRRTEAEALSTTLLHDSDLPSYLQWEGTRQFQEFIMQTYHGLIHADEHILKKGQLSNHRVFCRIDVSVFCDQEGSYKFFVNELAGTPWALLFLCYTHRQAPCITTDLANALRTMVALKRAQQIELEEA
jgi:hypothetical protein